MFTTLKECDGDFEDWYGITSEEFQDLWDEYRSSRNARKLRAGLEEFEEPIQQAQRLGIDQARAWQTVARATAATGGSAAKQLACWTRAYELSAKEQVEVTYDDLESDLEAHFDMADSAYEIARLHEAAGDLKKAAELYQRSVQHLQDAADFTDAHMNDENSGVPRRRLYLASFERVKQLQEKKVRRSPRRRPK